MTKPEARLAEAVKLAGLLRGAVEDSKRRGYKTVVVAPDDLVTLLDGIAYASSEARTSAPEGLLRDTLEFAIGQLRSLGREQSARLIEERIAGHPGGTENIGNPHVRVDGHRCQPNGPCIEDATTVAGALDVDRLARAITANWKLVRQVAWADGGTPLDIARAIAADYQKDSA